MLERLQERSHTCHDSYMGGLGTKQACAWFKNSSCVFRMRVHLLHVLRRLSVTRSLILDVSTCKVVCRRHDSPTNGPKGDPSTVRLPREP